MSDNIVDVNIRSPETGLSPEHGNCFQFNSLFFEDLLQSGASTDIDPCKVDYEKLRKWTPEVDLFSKDYIFIPILKSSHWNWVIICHLSNLTRLPGEMTRPPCVVHLNPIEGQHESFESLIRSYVFQAGMERFQASSNRDQLHALCQIKYVEAKVPEQDNFHDCGLHVLNYIKAFLMKSTSSDFSFPSSEMGPQFNGPHFVREGLGKRKHIRKIREGGHCWTEKETLKLLSCMVKGGRFYKGSGVCANWKLICEKINKKLGSSLSAGQCRLRYDTLLKAYKKCKKYCMENGKAFSEITEAERRALKLATTLNEDMYSKMVEIDKTRPKAQTSPKRLKSSSSVSNDLHPSGSLDSLARSPSPIARGSSFEDEAVGMDISLNVDWQLLPANLDQECPWPMEVTEGVDSMGVLQVGKDSSSNEDWQLLIDDFEEYQRSMEVTEGVDSMGVLQVGKDSSSNEDLQLLIDDFEEHQWSMEVTGGVDSSA